ncbi:MAG TPA: hypothetical protein VFZ44_17315 [Pyrinomonadaceae bacterium]
MNCQEFESRIDTLARGALADARTLREASAHEESCAPCAARLADERALSTGLRALATGMKNVEAPARVESALLAAFHAHAASGGEEDARRTVVAANVVPLVPRVPVRPWSWVKTAAVASMAAAASLALFVLVRPGAGVDTPRAEVKQSGAAANELGMIEPPPGAINGKKNSGVAKVNQAGVEELAPEAGGTLTDRSDRLVRQMTAPRPRATNASYSTGGGRSLTAQPSADARAQEIATEFIPLGQYAQAEEGHLVRVELPRSALASFGLPVNAEAAGGRVKADILLGEDGTARAIRFIR